MKKTLLALALCSSVAWATDAWSAELPDHVLGDAKAPVVVVEYASFSCSHCGDFYRKTMPEIEKKYIETGKVRFIYRDFPLNSYDLKASALAHCLPSEQFYPFVKTLFENAKAWTSSPKPEDVLVQYAGLAGLSADKARSCMDDAAITEALMDRRAEAIEKKDVTATPTFFFNDGAEKIVGAAPVDEFSAAIEKLLPKPQAQ